MNINNLNLKSLRGPLEEALSAYEAQSSIRFQDFPDFLQQYLPKAKITFYKGKINKFIC